MPTSTDVLPAWRLLLLNPQRDDQNYRGSAARALNITRQQVLVNIRHSRFWSEQSRQAFVTGKMLDPITAGAEFRAFATSHGQDLDVLVEGASKHFSSAERVAKKDPITAQELEILFEDDQRTFNR